MLYLRVKNTTSYEDGKRIPSADFSDTDREDMIINLKKILEISKFLYSLHEDENELFKFVNELPSTNLT